MQIVGMMIKVCAKYLLMFQFFSVLEVLGMS
jgi:hypothetical protein